MDIKIQHGFNPTNAPFTNIIYLAVGEGCIKIGKSVIKRATKRADELNNPKYSREVVQTVARYAIGGSEAYALHIESTVRLIIECRYAVKHSGLDYFYEVDLQTQARIMQDFYQILAHAENVAQTQIVTF